MNCSLRTEAFRVFSLCLVVSNFTAICPYVPFFLIFPIFLKTSLSFFFFLSLQEIYLLYFSKHSFCSGFIGPSWDFYCADIGVFNRHSSMLFFDISYFSSPSCRFLRKRLHLVFHSLIHPSALSCYLPSLCPRAFIVCGFSNSSLQLSVTGIV